MILVTTPAGKIGAHVAAGLRARGAPVRLGSRSPEAIRDRLPGAEVVPLDLLDPDSFERAVAGATGLYLVPPGEPFPDEPMERAIDLARAGGVERVAFVSAMGIERTDRRLERRLEASGMAWTILRPCTLMQNYSTSGAAPIRERRAVVEPAGEARTAFVDARDVAAVAVAALTEPGHAGRVHTLTGPASLDRHEVAAAISAAVGAEVRYDPVSEGAFRGMLADAMPPAQLDLLVWFYRVIRDGDLDAVTEDVPRLLGRPAIPFARFALDHRDAWFAER